MERMSFEKLLEQAKVGDRNAQEEIFRMYRPLLVKNAMEQNRFEEDLYQELSATLLNCIRKFRI
jgi:hypothetical protein